MPRDGRVYICDKDVAVTSFALSVAVIEYQTLVLRGDVDAAQEMLPDIPEDQKGKIARFLEGQGYKELALEVATDKEQKFELALALGQLGIALDLARKADVEHKWKVVGDAALSAWDLALAEECFNHAKDLGSLLLLYSASADVGGLRDLAAKAKESGMHNVSFSCLWQVGDVDACLNLLLETKRLAEAVLFAQTYRPSRCAEVVKDWKQSLDKSGKGKVARMLGVPGEDEEMFPEWDEYLRLEMEGGSKEADLMDVGNGDGEANGDSVEEAVGKAAPEEAEEGGEEEVATPETDTDAP